MISNIREAPQDVCARTNGGHQTSTHIGDFRNLGVVWFNPDSIANILYLSQVRKVCRVTMDTNADAAMYVYKLDGSLMKFKEHADGLYYYDPHEQLSRLSTSVYTLVNTVSDNKTAFVSREIELADKASAQTVPKIGSSFAAKVRGV
jgi:hypothetical protein